MNRERIIELAWEAKLDWHNGWPLEDGPNRYEVFAKLVAADALREAAFVFVEEGRYFEATRLREMADGIEGEKK